MEERKGVVLVLVREMHAVMVCSVASARAIVAAVYAPGSAIYTSQLVRDVSFQVWCWMGTCLDCLE